MQNPPSKLGSKEEDVVDFDDVREIPDGGNSSQLSTECMQNPPSKSGTKEEDVVVSDDVREIPDGGNNIQLSTECVQNPPSKSGLNGEEMVVSRGDAEQYLGASKGSPSQEDAPFLQ